MHGIKKYVIDKNAKSNAANVLLDLWKKIMDGFHKIRSSGKFQNSLLEKKQIIYRFEWDLSHVKLWEKDNNNSKKCIKINSMGIEF